MAKKKTALIILGLGVVGVGLYEYMKKRGEAIPVDAIGPGADQSGLLPPPVNQLPPPANFVPGGRVETQPVVIRDDVNQNPVGRDIDNPSRPQSVPAPSQTTAIPAGADTTPITETVKQTVMAWVDADGSPPIEAMGMARIPAEFNGMYDIIAGGWNPTPDQREFWNNLVAKYDPNHNYL